MSREVVAGDNTIQFAQRDDTSDLMDYINTNWKTGHILARDWDFFLYEYSNPDGLNFVISLNKSGRINGMLGFLPSSTQGSRSLWTTMWKVSPDTGNPMLGVQLLDFLRRRTNASLMSLGINPKTIAIYKRLGFEVGTARHFVLLNPSCTSFKIAQVSYPISSPATIGSVTGSLTLLPLSFKQLEDGFAQISTAPRWPQKDAGYFGHRFFEHPIYQYKIMGAFRKGRLEAVLVMRDVVVGDARATRLVDFWGKGEVLVDLSSSLYSFLVESKSEYLDILQYGMVDSNLTDAGFLEVQYASESLIIPNYFEPFVQKNVQVHFFCESSQYGTFQAFKADGDQDRPS